MVTLTVTILTKEEYQNSLYLRNQWESTHIIVVNDDGTNEVIKDRWSYPENTNKAEIFFPQP